MAKTYRLSELARILGLELQGSDIVIHGVGTLDEAGPNELSFLANPKYARQLASTRAGAVIVAAEHAAEVENALVSREPYTDFAKIIGLFAEPQGSFTGQSPLSFIHESAVVPDSCTVYPFVYVGARVRLGENCTLFPGVYVGEDVRTGAGCTLYPNSVLMAGTVIGERCVLQPGAVIGGEGFGFVRTREGMRKIPQIGIASLGDRVEVGVNSAVDRAALNATRIGEGTCLDNLVQVGHNVQMGKDCLIISQVGISGSTRIGDNVTMAGQAGVAGHLSIGDGVTIGPQAGVAKSIDSGETVGGHPTVPYATYLKNLTLMPRLPDLFKRVSSLEKTLAALETTGKNEEEPS